MRILPALRTLLPLLLLPLVLACSSLGSGEGGARIYDTRTGEEVTLDAMANDLASRDVVFLGEEHDNDVGHQLQLSTVRALYARHPRLAISLEQFEADVQGRLELYLIGAITEEEFLAEARPWPNYPQHYRPIVEFAREHGLPVLAANIPRPLASKVAHEDLGAIRGVDFAPRMVWTDEAEYAKLFAAAMGQGHGGGPMQAMMASFFAAQCVKDDMMAESMVELLAVEGEDPPLVVHLCGKFHSDYHLGTVSRLQRRRPTLDLAVVSMESDPSRKRSLTEDERRRGEYLWLVPPQ